MTSSWDINAVFKLFYEDLYTSEITASIEELESFFDKLTIPKVLLEEKGRLEATVREAEVKKSH